MDERLDGLEQERAEFADQCETVNQGLDARFDQVAEEEERAKKMKAEAEEQAQSMRAEREAEVENSKRMAARIDELEKAVADKDQMVSRMQSKTNDDCCTIQSLRLEVTAKWQNQAGPQSVPVGRVIQCYEELGTR
ncbi:TPA: hypothetical protein ACH3X3_004637 [Trebouxia sp. C0006]